MEAYYLDSMMLNKNLPTMVIVVDWGVLFIYSSRLQLLRDIFDGWKRALQKRGREVF